MAAIRIACCFFFALAASGLRADSYDWHAAEPRGDERAVLVLCPGMNSDGSHFLSEIPWVNFAEDHRLGLIALAFSSDPDDMYGDAKKGYYWPEQGSGDVLLEAVRSTYGGDLPIAIYGFSGGAQFTSRFVEWVPERILVWSAYSAQFWGKPALAETAAANPPGIVACGELDASRWFPSFSYFYQGRELGKPWTWVSIAETGHHRKGSFEEFVRNYFSKVLTAEQASGLLVDVDTEDPESFKDGGLQPGLTSYLPDARLLAAWRGVHHQ